MNTWMAPLGGELASCTAAMHRYTTVNTQHTVVSPVRTSDAASDVENCNHTPRIQLAGSCTAVRA